MKIINWLLTIYLQNEVIMLAKIKTILWIIACLLLWAVLQLVTGIPLKM